jgi:branched-chain amino acid transport system substrate-binding protein
MTRALTLTILCVFASSCATAPAPRKGQRPPRPTAPPQTQTQGTELKPEQATPKEQAEYKQIQKLYLATAYDVALQKLLAFEKGNPRSPLMPQVRNLHGLTHLLRKQPLLAIPQFKRAIELTPNADFRHFVLYNLAACHMDLGQVDEAQAVLAEIRPEALDKETRVKYHSMRAKVFQRKASYLEAARESLALSRLLDASQLRGPFITQLEDSLKYLTDTSQLEQLYKDYEDAPLVDLVLFRLGAQELAIGKPGSAESHLKQLVARFPQTTHYADATDLMRSIQSRNIVDSASVGVLLPMKGKFARFGARSLQAIQLAFRIFNLDEADTKVTLVLEDSGEEPEQALRALNNLYFKHHVSAVIGPLLSKGIDQVTQRAQELGLPIVTLSQQPGVGGDYVFQSGLTPKLQAREIARYAIEKMGLERFAIIYPRDRFGEQYSQSYWDAVESMGGKIVGIESYTPGDTDFRQVVDKLSGLYYTDARAKELEELAKEREQLGIKKRTRKTERYFALKPIVDYQAVFIPDEPKVVGQILPTFAYRDVDHVKFLGISTWNSQDLVTRAGAHAEGATFVDAFYPQDEAGGVRKFVERYKATFNEEPGAIEALSFDAAHILETVLSPGASRSREELKERLKGIRNFQGVTGRISYQEGQFARSLNVLTVQKGQILEVASGQR